MNALRTRIIELKREANRSRDETRQAVEREAEVKRVSREEKAALEFQVRVMQEKKADWTKEKEELEKERHVCRMEARAAEVKMEELRIKGRQLFT